MATDETRIRPPRPAGPGGGGAASLVFIEGEALLGVRVPLGPEAVLGRDPGCTLRLDAEDVSRRHARIAPEGDGHLVVDLGSTNGTWVNGREVERQRLASGDRLRIGPFVAKYLAAGDAEARYHDELSALARLDPLTRIPNRRALDEHLGRELARAARDGSALSVLVLDVDRFKRVNDVHGHPAGDAVLAAVAARAQSALRAGDLVARLGGEEFGVVLAGADLAAAAETAERIRARIAAVPVLAGETAIPVTVSIGCAALEAGEAGAVALLARADAKLYEAKEGGRNRVRW